LTGAEAHSARLVSDGSTNRDNADRLFLSPHTVNSRLRHIVAKLAINSRAELARIVAEQNGAARAEAAFQLDNRRFAGF
jgi:DNA-binding CsgD family transcriptional regulator